MYTVAVLVLFARGGGSLTIKFILGPMVNPNPFNTI